MLSLGEMARILGDHPANFLPGASGQELPRAVVTDSRQVEEGSLFIAIRGERVDGHDFIARAAERGALAALASRDVFDGKTPPLPVLYAEDAVAALGRLGAAQRDAFKGLVVGVTGSAGKTSVKEVLAAVLGERGRVGKNRLNLNSQIGLPVSLLNADVAAWAWVLEAGISAPRDMDELGAILRPDLALILNVGAAHLSGLEDRGVAYYKSRLLKYPAPGGRALISADYPDLVRECRALAAETGLDVKYFSRNDPAADYYAAYLGPTSPALAASGGRYQVRIKGGDLFEVNAPFRGSYGAENVAAVSGAAHLAGLAPEEIIRGLAEAELPAQRFARQSRGDFTLIDDCYNSNPLSSARMLESAAELAAENGAPLFLALGEMLELGGECIAAHRELGRRMAASRAGAIIWKERSAEAGRAVRAGLAEGGFAGVFRQADGPEEFAALLPLLDELARAGQPEQSGQYGQSEQSGRAGRAGRAARPRGVILFKASRGLRLELWVEAFKNNYFLNLEE